MLAELGVMSNVQLQTSEVCMNKNYKEIHAESERKAN